MADKSSIEWTEATLNPWTGCTKVSAGCARCYISRQPPFRTAGRDWERGKIPLVFHMERLEKMVRRQKPTMYFVNSLSDLFHEDASDEKIMQVFEAMARAPQHTFQILTKRPERMRALLSDWDLVYQGLDDYPWPLPNVWLGVTIENRQFAYRANFLRETPAAVRFISAEPLLGPLVPYIGENGVLTWDPVRRRGTDGIERVRACLDLRGIDWIIVGGESGPGARRFELNWARDLLRYSRAEGVAFFLKQLGGLKPGGELEDFPPDLRIREYPVVPEQPREGALF